jgi:putative transcriptional regulator
MNTTHHPTEETLSAFMDGSIDVGRRVVVAAHMELCASCRRLVRALDAMGGAYLDQLPATPLGDGALEAVLGRLDVRPSVRTGMPAPGAGDLPIALGALAPYELGPWRWIGPGVHWRSVSVPARDGSRVFLLKAAPGTHLPHHAHQGTELTVILKGAFAHDGGRFGVGDCDDADHSVEHKPVVEEGEECICLVCMHGNIRLLSLVGRLIQPFVRM